MSTKIILRNRAFWALFFLSFFCLVGISAERIKLKIIVDKASLKATPEIGGQTLASLPLQTILEAEFKQGEWYKVSMTQEGVQLSGFIHEMLVEEVPAGEAPPVASPAGVMKTQAEITAEIDLKLEENKNLIRQERELDKALDELRPLLAKAFTVEERQRQKQKACEIYLWLGIGSAKRGNSYGALKEFRNMFEVDFALAKEITRNIYDPALSNIIDQAEKQYRGLLVEYSLEISTEPKEATVKIDGKEIGQTPEVFRTTTPKFTLEIEKKGFRTIREEIFLSQASTRRNYILESIGRTVALSSDPSGAKVYLDREDTGLSTPCELPYVPYGAHTIRIEKTHYAPWEETFQVLEGKTPLAMDVVLAVKDYVPAHRWGGPESRFFKLPRGIAFDKEGNFYIVDESEVKVKKFDPEGRFQSGWAEAGKEFRVLKGPKGIAIDGQGYLYITDAKNACVMKFTKNGKFATRWGKAGSKPEELLNPAGIAIDSNGNVYVADAGNDRIVKYSAQGKLSKTWGKKGTGEGEFLFPIAVAVTKKIEIIVADRSRLQKFTPEGEFIQAWGRLGLGEGELNRPVGLAVDSNDCLYVADAGNHRILKFDPNGQFIAQWGSQGIAEGQMAGPAGVAVSSQGVVFVVEKDNNRLQSFQAASQ
ncbi:MAG: PEGA domain-containing protein [Candidatus Aminicenantales bacterium]